MKSSKNSIILPTSVLSIKNFLVNFVALFLPLYYASIGFTGFEIGVLLSIFAVTSLISSSIAGYFSDRYPIKYLSVFSFGFLIIYSFGLAATMNFWMVFILFLIGGLGNNISEISLNSFVLKIIERKKAGKLLAIFNSIVTIIAGVGALVGGLVLAKMQFVNVFVLLGYLFFIGVLLSLFIKKIATFKYGIEHYKGDIWKKEIILFIVIIFIFTLHWGAESTSYALFLKDDLKLNQSGIGLYIGVAWIIYGIFIYFVGKPIQRDKLLSKTIFFGLILSGIGDILFIYPDLAISFSFRLIHELGDAAVWMFLFMGIHKHFPTSRIGGTSGVIITVTVLGRFLGSIIFGPMGDHFGYGYPFIVTGILTLLSLIIARYYINSVKIRNETKNA